MKDLRRKILSITILLIFISIPLWAQFEGTIITTTTGTKEDNTPFTIKQEISIKGKKIRSDMTSTSEQRGSVVMILRGDKGRLYMIFDQTKKYVELSKKMIEEMMKNIPKDQNTVIVTQTGKMERILGYACEQILLKQGDMTIDVWGTSELTSIRLAMQMLNEYQKQSVPRWSKEIENLKLFPMKTTVKAHGISTEVTITSIQRKSLPASIFEIPAGYTKQQLPAGQSGMKKR